MADKDTLWTDVKAAYDSKGLVALTNIRDRTQTTVDDTVGTAAAQQAIDYFPLYAEVAFDVTDSQHLAVALRVTVAVLQERKGTATSIAQVTWEECEKLFEKLRRIGARARVVPTSNSGTSQPSELVSGKNILPWSHPSAYPSNCNLPSDRIADHLS